MNVGERTYKYERQTYYPGLKAIDGKLWDEFVYRNPTAFLSVKYNVHLGNPSADPNAEAKLRASGAFEVMQWCIDVLAWDGTDYTIIEIKPDARAGAIGQALAYRALAIGEGLVPDTTRALVLTDNLSPITERAAQLLGVGILVP